MDKILQLNFFFPKFYTPFSKTQYELLLISASALFLELLVIRWISSEIRIFAYFKNLSLMAAYFGFGLGFFFHSKADNLLLQFPKFIATLSVIIGGAGFFNFTYLVFVDPREYFLLGAGFGDHEAQSPPSPLTVLWSLVVMTSLFFLIVATFASLTAKVGSLLEYERPLQGYSINVLGSFIGIVGFSLVSYFCLPPYIWLFLALTPLLYFYKGASYKIIGR